MTSEAGSGRLRPLKTSSEAGSGRRSTRKAPALADAAWRQMIEERLDLNLLVEAGAGSGKTHSLAARMAAGIVSGRYRVEELAAVTFTRKAAAELRGRFQLALERRLAAARGDERDRIQRALEGLEHLFAGTIHAFCAHLLRERPVEAGVAPGFTELDELQDAEVRQRAWRDYLAQLRARQSPELHALQRARVSARDLDGAFQKVCTFDEVDFPPGDATEPDVADARRAAEAFWTALDGLMPTPSNPDAKCHALDRARQFGALLRAAASLRPADLAEALRCFEKLPKVTMKWWADGAARQHEVRDAVQALMAGFQEATVLPFLSAWRRYVYRLAVTVLAGAREFARGERRRALTLNYGDLLWTAAALLRGNPGVRAAMQRKYRWLLVDEFQDTDPIQAEVMLMLAADERGGDGVDGNGVVRDPYALRLRDGALFVVGDPKQSIYRFRRADIDVYHRVADTIRRNGRVVPLTTSFRARPSLCQWNNRVFESLLPPAPTAHQAAVSPLDPDPAWKPAGTEPMGESGRCTLTVPGAVGRYGHAAWDSQAIARFIRGEVDAGRAAPADFLVLTRKKKSLWIYAAALQAQHVPVEVSGAGAFGGSPVVLALVNLLRALGDPGDGLAVVGVLRGPLFGISDRRLFEHRHAGGHFGLSARRPPADEGAARPGEASVLAALDRLGGFLRVARSLPLAAAVERIVEDCGFLALAASEGAGAAAGDVLHAVDLVREAAERGGGLADAADALERAAGSAEIESVPLEPGRRDVVRVMNVHKAKGLEARVVFLADPLGGPKKTVDVRIVRADGAGLGPCAATPRDGDPGGASSRVPAAGSSHGFLAIGREVGEHGTQLLAHPEGWDRHQAAELAYGEAEETRLLYVAATRARELLVVSRCDEGSRTRPWGALDPHLDDAPELPDGGRDARATDNATRSGSAVDLSATARGRAALGRAKRRQAAWQPSWAVARVTAPAHAGFRDSMHEGRGEGERAQAHGGAARPAGPAWGSLVHQLLEYAVRHEKAGPEDLRRLAAWSVVETPELRPFVEEAAAVVERVRALPFWAEARSGAAAHAEVPFAVAILAGASFEGLEPSRVPAVLRGVIDLVYRAPDGWRIVDYKTAVSLAPGETLLARHGRQLAAYQQAFERATGEHVSGRGIVAVRAGTVEWA